MAKECASVYKRQGKLFLVTSSQTPGRYGLWIDAGPHLVVGEEASLEEIGQRLDEALRGSRQNVAYPEDPKGLEKPLLELAGVKSWRTFMSGTSHCFVERNDVSVRVVPSTNDGRGFVPRSDSTVDLTARAQPEVLAEAVLAALAR